MIEIAGGIILAIIILAVFFMALGLIMAVWPLILMVAVIMALAGAPEWIEDYPRESFDEDAYSECINRMAWNSNDPNYRETCKKEATTVK